VWQQFTAALRDLEKWFERANVPHTLLARRKSDEDIILDRTNRYRGPRFSASAQTDVGRDLLIQ